MPEEQAFQTLAIAIFGGAFITVLARKWQLPTIVFLFAGGAALGPSALGLVHPDSLGPILPAIVALAIGVILFEGGLTLDPRAYSSHIAERLCVKAMLEPALLVSGLEDPITISYFIVSPAGDPQGHLATLAGIARNHQSNPKPQKTPQPRDLPKLRDNYTHLVFPTNNCTIQYPMSRPPT